MVGHSQCPIVSFNETTIECMVPKTHHKHVGEVLQVNVSFDEYILYFLVYKIRWSHYYISLITLESEQRKEVDIL